VLTLALDPNTVMTVQYFGGLVLMVAPMLLAVWLVDRRDL